jgi:hypothetical protein
MTSTGEDAKLPPHGHDDPRVSIRSLDPVDRNAPPPDGTHLLQAVLATPRQTGARRRGVRLLRLTPVGLALALLAGVVAVSIAGSGRSEEREAASGSGGGVIIHYTVRESWVAPDGSRQPAFTHEHWQLEDGSRARTVSDWEGAGPLQGKTTEDVVTSTQTLAYRPGSDDQSASIIRYRATDDYAAIPEDPPTFGAPPIGGSPDVGDPRTVPGRLADGDEDVTQLADGTVRDIAVKQFQVGDCREATRTKRKGDQVAVRMPQRAIVALARETLAPVRVTYEACRGDRATALEGRILDYLSFEELAHTPENLKRLELSPYPGVPVVDGIDIDKAEERDEGGPAPESVPTPTATPAPDEGVLAGPSNGG